MRRFGWRRAVLESLEERQLLAVSAGWESASVPQPITAEAPSTVVTTLADIVDPNDGLISFREAVNYAADLGTPVTFGLDGTCQLNAPIEITGKIDINAYWVTFVPGAEGFYAAFRASDADWTMTGGTISGFADSGIQTFRSNVSLNYLTISDCSSAFDGGGMAAHNSDVTLQGVSFYYNQSASRGGGFFFDGNGASLSLTACYAIGNNAVGGLGLGGGVAFLGGGSFQIRDTYIDGNRAEGSVGEGGGIWCVGDLTGDSLYAMGNAAVSTGRTSHGGGICVAGGAVRLSMAEISGNYAEEGAGIDAAPYLTLYQSTVAGNSSEAGGFGGIYARSGGEVYNTIVAQNNGGETNLAAESFQYSMVGGDPLFTRFAPYETADWDPYLYEMWYLLPSENSPAIDAGSDSLALESDGETLIEYDIDGMNRFNRIVDAGVYENQSVIVTTTEDIVADDGEISLREAVAIVNASWATVTVRFAESIRGETFYLNAPLELYGSIDLDGGGTAVIDGQGLSQLFYVSSGRAVFNGLTFANGCAEEGGAIYGFDADLTITDSLFINNQASLQGGAVSLNESFISLNGTQFLMNRTDGDGGAVYACDSMVMAYYTSFHANSASRGGAAAFNSTFSDFRVNSFSASEIKGNTAFYGGGIAVLGEASFKLDLSDLVENAAFVSGGGAYVEGTFYSDSSRISGNDVDDNVGGGIFNAGTATLANTILAANRAAQGSAVQNTGTLTLYNVTIAGNCSGEEGYALRSSGTAAVYNSIVSLNLGGDLIGAEPESSLVGVDPLFWRYTPYAESDWDAALYTNWDFTPIADSPAVDAGNNDYALSSEGWSAWSDQAGNTRIVNEVVDIGALEAQNAPDTPSIVSVSSMGANWQKVEWTPVWAATGYRVLWSTSDEEWNVSDNPDTSAVLVGLPYGAVVTYRVMALGAGDQVSDWSEPVSVRVCPMDIDGDGTIGPLDRALFASVWLCDSDDADWNPACDIDGDGEITGLDRALLTANWLKDADDPDLRYPGSF